MPELGGNQERVFEVDLVAVDIDIYVFPIRGCQPPVDLVDESSLREVVLFEGVEWPDGLGQYSELLDVTDLERELVSPVLEQGQAPSFLPRDVGVSPHDNLGLSEP